MVSKKGLPQGVRPARCDEEHKLQGTTQSAAAFHRQDEELHTPFYRLLSAFI